MELDDAARDLADGTDALAFATKVQGGPLPGDPEHSRFMAEVDALRAELAAAEPFQPGPVVAAAHAAIRIHVVFLDRDRAMDGEVATMVQMVADGEVLAAVRAATAS